MRKEEIYEDEFQKEWNLYPEDKSIKSYVNLMFNKEDGTFEATFMLNINGENWPIHSAKVKKGKGVIDEFIESTINMVKKEISGW